MSEDGSPMSAVPAVLSEQRLIESFDADVKGRLKPHVLFAYLVNCAWKHSSFTDHGYEDLRDRNQMWVLAKLQLSVIRYPRWGEKILIETWGKGVRKLYALRDFTVTAPQGEKLASATSAWLVLDRSNRRPVRIDQMTFPWMPGRNELETDLEKVPALSGASPQAQFRVVFSDIDVNGHVTATKYLQWITDSNPAVDQKQLSYLEISFLGEAAMGDEVTVCRGQETARGELWNVTRTGDQKELCRAEMVWTWPA